MDADPIARAETLIPYDRAVPLSRLRAALDAAGQPTSTLRADLEARPDRFIVFEPPCPGWVAQLRSSAGCADYGALLAAAGIASEPHVVRRRSRPGSPAAPPMVPHRDRGSLGLLWSTLERAWDATDQRPADRRAVAAALLEAGRITEAVDRSRPVRADGRHLRAGERPGAEGGDAGAPVRKRAG